MEPPRVLPQENFTDLYTAVYRLIDDAKESYSVIKLYKGSHGSPNPHEIVTDFGKWFFAERRGLFAYACSLIRPGFNPTQYDTDDLYEFDFTYKPRVRLSAVFAALAQQRHPDESEQQFLSYIVTREHQLGAYRGGSSGYDDEARAFMCAYFRRLEIQCAPDDVMIFNGGAKAVFLAACAAIMCTREFDELHRTGGVILAPTGYYQSLRLIPAVFGATIHVETELTRETVTDWLADTEHLPGRALYVPLVNNMDGRVLTQDQAHGIADAVIEHNLTTENPAYVIGDDVYAGSYLTESDDPPCPIGAVPGIEPWCVSVVTPSKTTALPTGRVAFAAATNPRLRAALSHYRTVFSHGRVPQITELASAAALCLTPQQWVDTWNGRYIAAVRSLSEEVRRLNEQLGAYVYDVESPQGGWYVPLRIRRDLFGPRVATGLDAQSILLYYGEDNRQTGVAMLPGELFGHASDETWHTLRANIAVKPAALAQLVDRLGQLARATRLDSRDEMISYALTRARRVVPDLDRTVASTHY